METFSSYLSDNETKVDLLNNHAIAATVVCLLQGRPERPVTVGVHGDWGAGKSSILEMIEAELDDKNDVLCLKFNGWQFQGFEDAKIALIEGIVTGLLEKRPALTKATEVVKDTFRRIDKLKLATKVGGLALTAFTGIPNADIAQGVVSALKTIANDPTKLATKESLGALVGDVQSVVKPAEPHRVPEEIAEFRKAFDKLLDEAKVKQLVVLIDDLDRCLPDTAIETLEAVRLFVFRRRTAFVVAADEAMIEYAVTKHFPELPESGPQSYARNYLEKLVQVPFRIPALGTTETRIYVTLLLIGSELPDEDDGFANLIAAARDRLKRPWKGEALDAALIKEKLGDRSEQGLRALGMSEQIAPILASGTKGNPRQVKRFLNALILRKLTADARGFGEDIALPVLAKLMLAERFIPHLFDQIASAAVAAPDGKCSDLASLEAVARGESLEPAKESKTNASGKKKSASGSSAVDAKESEILKEWLSSSADREWAAVDPRIASIDLHPYLFVVKDRKDYFAATSILGHLATLAGQLMGPQMAVQALQTELQSLSIPEARQLFEVVRARVLSGGSFKTEPPGVAGLTALVRAQPGLQTVLIDFLEALPRNVIGPWVVQGWNVVFTDQAAKTRFQSLLKAWSEVSDNQPLRAAASGVLRIPKGKQ
jgi:predicted KAP-like P-loop ATPase